MTTGVAQSPYKVTPGDSNTKKGRIPLSLPGFLPGVIPTKQMLVALIHWFTIPSCVYDVTV